MGEALLFAGTTEGRQLAAALQKSGVALTACVATEYGAAQLPKGEGQRVLCGRQDENEMEQLMRKGRYACVCDATHPFARVVSENIKSACQAVGLPLIRVIRSAVEQYGAWEPVGSCQEAAQRLIQTNGNILLTTGVNELDAFLPLPDFASRTFVRVLPSISSLSRCLALGVPQSHIIAMQGPFSAACNMAAIEHCKAKWLVTKESGQAGGFYEKLEAAQRCQIGAVVITRPCEQDGGVPIQQAAAKILALCTQQG